VTELAHQTKTNQVALADHADTIRRLGKRATADIDSIVTTTAIEIGRHLTEAKAEVGHGHFGNWIDKEFGWSDRTARNFMYVYALSLKSETVSDLRLPMRALYLLAAPSTPEQARTEILERAEAGEPVTGVEVKEAIKRVKRKKTNTGGLSKAATMRSLRESAIIEKTRAIETGGTAADDDAAASAEKRKRHHAAEDGDLGHRDDDAGDDGGNRVEEPAETLVAHWDRATRDERAAFLDAIGVKGMLANMSSAFGRELRGRIPTKPQSKYKNITLSANPPPPQGSPSRH
jgi:hypothetical protein